jgi:hypothetical protein
MKRTCPSCSSEAVDVEGPGVGAHAKGVGDVIMDNRPNRGLLLLLCEAKIGLMHDGSTTTAHETTTKSAPVHLVLLEAVNVEGPGVGAHAEGLGDEVRRVLLAALVQPDQVLATGLATTIIIVFSQASFCVCQMTWCCVHRLCIHKVNGQD